MSTLREADKAIYKRYGWKRPPSVGDILSDKSNAQLSYEVISIDVERLWLRNTGAGNRFTRDHRTIASALVLIKVQEDT